MVSNKLKGETMEALQELRKELADILKLVDLQLEKRYTKKRGLEIRKRLDDLCLNKKISIKRRMIEFEKNMKFYK